MRLLARRAHVSEPASIKHLDLFSGIGGFALAADWTWPNVQHLFCEIDPFCQSLLKQHFPNSPIYGDIKELDGRQLGPIDLLTGGFPCQPFSLAGKRKGESDDRFLWPHMLRIISETKPRWVIGEKTLLESSAAAVIAPPSVPGGLLSVSVPPRK